MQQQNGMMQNLLRQSEKTMQIRTDLQLIWQVLGEPGVGLDACNGDPVGWVANKDLAHHVQALPRDVQVGGEAILHTHDPLQMASASV